MRIVATLGFAIFAWACSGASTMVPAKDADDGGGPPGDDGGGPPGDDGGGVGPTFVYGTCGASKPLTAGSISRPHSSVTLHWPAPWTAPSMQTSNTFEVTEPYSYLPTGSTTPRQISAVVTLFDDDVRTSVADAQQQLDMIATGIPAAQLRRFDIDGRPTLLYWTQAPPPQPGCEGCPGDPGPDIVTISLVSRNGLHLVELSAGVRLNAPADVFCDVQAIETGITY